ncbi:glycogen synthase GlgA [Bordetella hinzii]|uniref:glycogen synthase GlgA n=1 Tax=Bordetella hinzii TaxID=103855 RepID=UPI0009B87DB0|nr:glycogen synthase GlgA [Bordetella hinzii]QDJ43297.1 starch synthase [Bordetella hinzii]
MTTYPSASLARDGGIRPGDFLRPAYPPSVRTPPARILSVAGEAYPLAKTGGLADAVTGLAQALRQRGLPLQLLMPAYRGTRQRLRLRRSWALPDLPGGPARLLLGHCRSTGLPCLLLENAALYDRPGCYVDEQGRDYADNALRYAALAHAAAAIARGLPGLAPPDIVQAHDWHAGLAPWLVRQAAPGVRTVFTVHNLAFQGSFDAACLPALSLAPAQAEADGLIAWGQLNFLRAGILHADKVTTVSHHYAREILTARHGCGLDGELRARGEDFLALPNGVDTALWNPASDPHLGEAGFDASSLANKRRWKTRVQQAFGLQPDPSALLVVSCSRLTEQKMADLTVAALPRALDALPRLQFAVLGRGGAGFEQALRQLADAYPGRMGARIGYDEAAAHQLQAGADALWHPSRFEPFGLTPLYAMRYGTLPLATPVGGLVDTIQDPGPDAPRVAMMSATGLLFDGGDAEAVLAVLRRALALYDDAAIWRVMQRNAMLADFGWPQAVQGYLRLFSSLLGRPAEAEPGARATARGQARSPAPGAAPAIQGI